MFDYILSKYAPHAYLNRANMCYFAVRGNRLQNLDHLFTRYPSLCQQMNIVSLLVDQCVPDDNMDVLRLLHKRRCLLTKEEGGQKSIEHFIDIPFLAMSNYRLGIARWAVDQGFQLGQDARAIFYKACIKCDDMDMFVWGLSNSIPVPKKHAELLGKLNRKDMIDALVEHGLNLSSKIALAAHMVGHVELVRYLMCGHRRRFKPSPEHYALAAESCDLDLFTFLFTEAKCPVDMWARHAVTMCRNERIINWATENNFFEQQTDNGCVADTRRPSRKRRKLFHP